jgi:hypothetical protein
MRLHFVGSQGWFCFGTDLRAAGLDKELGWRVPRTRHPRSQPDYTSIREPMSPCEAALAVVVGTHHERDVGQRDDDHHRPKDQ